MYNIRSLYRFRCRVREINMTKTVMLLGKQVTVHLSDAARHALNHRKHHLCLEMELYFSCLIRKQVKVRPAIDNGISVFVSDKLEIGFKPVITQSCSANTCAGNASQSNSSPINKPERYIPSWLHVDFKKGEWCSEFGYSKREQLLS